MREIYVCGFSHSFFDYAIRMTNKYIYGKLEIENKSRKTNY